MTASGSTETRLRLATIRLHRALARAHEAYADEVSVVTEQVDVEEPLALRGSLQRRLVARPEMATMGGMTSREAAAVAGGDEPNTHAALKGLTEKGVVEIVGGSSPQRFRLAVKHRRDRVLRLSRLIREGEWTTYGEFSIAVYDSPRMALTVARVAARHPAFANPHRILQAAGSVSSEWRDEDRAQGPEECKRRLAAEGVWDETSDRATHEARLDWAELQRRLSEDAEGDEAIEGAPAP